MLSTFRNHTKGWIAWVFVILISVPFALWGIGQYRSVFSADYVAKVNGETIMPNDFQRAWQNYYQQQENQLGDKFNPSDKEQQALKEQVLNQLIDRTLLRQQAARDGLVTGEAELQAQIAQIQAFQSGGKFDFAQYQAVLASNGYSVKQFEASMRTDITVQQLQNGLAQSAFTTPKEADVLIGILQQQRKIAWFSLPLDHFSKQITPPGDDQIQAYYTAHRDRFMVPQTVTIAYVRLGPKTLEARVKPTPDALKSYYVSHQSQYGIPPARKTAEILIKPAPASTKGWASAKAQATQLLGQIRGSRDQQKKFAALAAKYSDDPTSKRNGGALGWVGRGQMPTAFDQVLFGLKQVGDVAGPVRTKDGWTLIQLLGTRGGSVKPYDQVAQKVEKDYRADKAKDLYFGLGDQLANLAYEHADSLDPVAKALGLKVQTISGVTRKQGTGVASKEPIRAAAFSASVLQDHQNSEPVKLGADDAVVLRVTDETPAHPKPLASVHDKIAKLLVTQQAQAKAKATAAKAVKDLRAGQKPEAVAGALGAKLQGPSDVARSGSKLPSQVVKAAFDAPPHADGSPRYGTVTLANGDQAVYAMLGVNNAKSAKIQPMMQQIYSLQLSQMNAGQADEDYVAWLRKHANIKLVKQNIP